MHKKLLLPLLSLTLAFGVASAPAQAKKEEKKDAKPAAKEVAVLKFKDFGEITVEFFPEVAPGHVENFKKLANQKFYDGTQSHRLIPGFMIQLGDPLTKDPSKEAFWGTGDPGYKIKAEFNDRPHDKGVLSMARSASPDSAGSQFFICLADAKFLDRQYTAFGQLIGGDDVLEAIGSVDTTFAGGREKSRPTRRMSVESVQIVPRDSVKL